MNTARSLGSVFQSDSTPVVTNTICPRPRLPLDQKRQLVVELGQHPRSGVLGQDGGLGVGIVGLPLGPGEPGRLDRRQFVFHLVAGGAVIVGEQAPGFFLGPTRKPGPGVGQNLAVGGDPLFLGATAAFLTSSFTSASIALKKIGDL